LVLSPWYVFPAARTADQETGAQNSASESSEPQAAIGLPMWNTPPAMHSHNSEALNRDRAQRDVHGIAA